MKSSEYINQERKAYSLYLISDRAIPHVADGLKSALRRVLWMARDGKKVKSSALAGSCAAIHPHAAPEGSINTAAAPYGNNIPLLKGYGAFGTLLKPTAYGASRYTSVALSEFAKDVIFADANLIPMVDNYDGTIKEPKHLLPLVPTVLLNPQEGIAVGFASNILPRSITDIIYDQVLHLQGKSSKIVEAPPSLDSLGQTSSGAVVDRLGKTRWVFTGAYDKINATTVRITKLPYGLTHKKLTTTLDKLEEVGTIVDVVDNSSDVYDILIKFKKGTLTKLDDAKILKMLGLELSVPENLNVVDFDGVTVWSTNYTDVVTRFTDWRLQYYITRYEVLAAQLEIDIQRLRDVILAVKKNIGSVARKIKSKAELKEYLGAIGIVHTEYIADLPVYRFTEDERIKAETKLAEHEATMDRYRLLLSSEPERKQVYIKELKDVLKKVNANRYASIE